MRDRRLTGPRPGDRRRAEASPPGCRGNGDRDGREAARHRALHRGPGAPGHPGLQSLFDPLYPPGLQWYWRGDFFDGITDEAIDAHLEFGSRVPTMHSTMHLYPVDGAPHRVGHETAWSYRDAVWSGVIGGIDPDPTNGETIKQWCVDYWAALPPHSMGGAYPNFMMEEGQERVRAAYRGNYDRLGEHQGEVRPHELLPCQPEHRTSS